MFGLFVLFWWGFGWFVVFLWGGGGVGFIVWFFERPEYYLLDIHQNSIIDVFCEEGLRKKDCHQVVFQATKG